MKSSHKAYLADREEERKNEDSRKRKSSEEKQQESEAKRRKEEDLKKIDGLRKSIKELNEMESKAEEMLQSACAFLEEGNERMAKGVADKNMNEIEAAQKIIELAQEKQKKAKHELETVHKEKQKIRNELEEKVKMAKSK